MARGCADARKIRGRYEIIEHTADIGICVKAESLEELFALAACAMFDLMVDISRVEPARKTGVSLSADSLDELLVAWLNELIFRAEVDGSFFSRFEVDSVTDRALEASVMGEPYDEKRHPIGTSMKAATYHELDISPSDTGWVARVIFDV